MPGLDGFETKDVLPAVEAGVTPMAQAKVEVPEEVKTLLKEMESMSA